MRSVLIATIVILIVGALTACRQAANKQGTQEAQAQYRTDVEPIQRRLPGLAGIERCYWKGGLYKEGFSGVPSLDNPYWMKGFVLLTKGEGVRIGKAYQWYVTSAGWVPPIDASVTGIAPSKWLAGPPEYNASIKGTRSLDLNVFLDKDHNLLYFEISGR